MDWGAEKLNFRCPDCENEELVRVGLSDDKVLKKPTLKRRPRKPVASIHATEEEILVPDIEDIEAEEVEVEPEVEEEAEAGILLGTDDEGTQVGLDIEEVIPAEDIAVAPDTDLAAADDLGFGSTTPPLGDEALDDSAIDSDEWSK